MLDRVFYASLLLLSTYGGRTGTCRLPNHAAKLRLQESANGYQFPATRYPRPADTSLSNRLKFCCGDVMQPHRLAYDTMGLALEYEYMLLQ
jgi:hypothetical protein